MSHPWVTARVACVAAATIRTACHAKMEILHRSQEYTSSQLRYRQRVGRCGATCSRATVEKYQALSISVNLEKHCPTQQRRFWSYRRRQEQRNSTVLRPSLQYQPAATLVPPHPGLPVAPLLDSHDTGMQTLKLCDTTPAPCPTPWQQSLSEAALCQLGSPSRELHNRNARTMPPTVTFSTVQR
jgi:hypothetical protein